MDILMEQMMVEVGMMEPILQGIQAIPEEKITGLEEEFLVTREVKAKTVEAVMVVLLVLEEAGDGVKVGLTVILSAVRKLMAGHIQMPWGIRTATHLAEALQILFQERILLDIQIPFLMEHLPQMVGQTATVILLGKQHPILCHTVIHKACQTAHQIAPQTAHQTVIPEVFPTACPTAYQTVFLAAFQTVHPIVYPIACQILLRMALRKATALQILFLNLMLFPMHIACRKG